MNREPKFKVGQEVMIMGKTKGVISEVFLGRDHQGEQWMYYVDAQGIYCNTKINECVLEVVEQKEDEMKEPKFKVGQEVIILKHPIIHCPHRWIGEKDIITQITTRGHYKLKGWDGTHLFDESWLQAVEEKENVVNTKIKAGDKIRTTEEGKKKYPNHWWVDQDKEFTVEFVQLNYDTGITVINLVHVEEYGHGYIPLDAIELVQDNETLESLFEAIKCKGYTDSMTRYNTETTIHLYVGVFDRDFKAKNEKHAKEILKAVKLLQEAME